MATERIEIIIEGKDKASGALSSIQSGLGGIATVAGGILTAGILTKVGQGFVNLGKSAIDSVGHVQALEIGMESLIARQKMYQQQGDMIVATGVNLADAMDMAKDETQDLLGFVEKLAIVSPFETKDIELVTRLGLGAKFSTGFVKELSAAFLDYAAGVGITSTNLGFAADQFIQIKKAGKLTAIDLRQLRRLGIDLAEIIGVKMGMSVEEFNDKVEDSPELMDQLFQSFVEFSNETFSGAAERMSKTIPGMMSTAHDLVEVGSRNLFRPIIEALTPTFSGILDEFSSFVTGPKIKILGKLLGGAITGAMEGDFKWAIANLGGVLATLGMEPEKVTAFTNSLEGLVGTIQNLAGAFKKGGIGGLASAIGLTPESLGTAWDTAMTGLLDLIVQSWPQVQTTLSTLGGQFWSWLSTDVIPAANLALDNLTASIVEWSADPDTQTQLGILGQNVGTMLIDGIAESPALVGLGFRLLGKLFSISLDLQEGMNNIGSGLATGIAHGIIEGLGLEGVPAAIAAGIEAALAKAIQLVNPVAFIMGTIREGFGSVETLAGLIPKESGPVRPYQSGGVVPGPIGSPQLGLLHGGETVVPTHQGPMTVVVPVYLNGREIARALGQQANRQSGTGAGIRL